ncbi:MAG: hypothetical protein EPN47_13250 [Acidobacteria bacterium]|nr:MAG: hypothetical protein EPN47_13250 [Acidobacteriota bacterium]
MTRLYWRCNGGHYFCTLCCPYDGWSSPELRDLHTASERLRSKNVLPSLDALRAEGMGETAIKRAIVIEFGSEEAVFDAISPRSYVVGGKEITLAKAKQGFL